MGFVAASFTTSYSRSSDKTSPIVSHTPAYDASDHQTFHPNCVRLLQSWKEDASRSWGETFGDQKRHRLVCGKLLEKDDPARITQKLPNKTLTMDNRL